MGFDSSKYGKRKYTNDSFKFENEYLTSFWTVEANGEILPELIVRQTNLKCLFYFRRLFVAN
jgi:hypothetical protein